MEQTQESGLPRFAQNLLELPATKLVGIALAVALSTSLLVSIVLWGQEKPYALLMNPTSQAEAGEVIEILEQKNVDYRISSSNGQILVPKENLHALRISLASSGFPKSKANGYELLDGKQDFGVSQFKETTQYHRALEGELSKTIKSIKAIKSAKVMLGLPKQSVFSRKKQEPTASVTVEMHAGRSMSDDQVRAIVHLVSSSIPLMKAENVTVVDALGTLLTDDSLSGSSMKKNLKKLNYKRNVENGMKASIIDLLSPIIGGRDLVKAKVTLEMDFTESEETKEDYQADPSNIRSEQLLYEFNRDKGAKGVPGALSNQPINQNNLNNDPTIKSGSNKAVKNYELDKVISHTKLDTGVIKRISVAIVVDDKITVVDGEAKKTPLTQEDIQSYRQLIIDAIALNEVRGDSITVVNASFAPVIKEVEEKVEIWEETWFFDLSKLALSALGVLLILLLVIRPLIRDLNKRYEAGGGEQEKAEEDKEAPKSNGDDDIELFSENMGQDIPASETLGTSTNIEDEINRAQKTIDDDAKRTAGILKQWMKEDQ
jgi:flagellar M-ring protein FliF